MTGSPTTRVTPLPRLAQISFRVTELSGPMAARALGLDRLPPANQFSAGDGCNVLWLGPDEFLAVGVDQLRGQIETRLREAIPPDQGAVVDVSAGRVGFGVAGADARDVLAGCCSIDVHPRVFRTGSCAATLIAKAQAVIAQIDDGPTYLILVRPSFAPYVKGWLLR